MTGPTANVKVFGRGTNLGGPRFLSRAERKERARSRERREQLEGFLEAVRGKEYWFFKVLDGRNLAAKWVVEAQLDEGPDLDAAIRELKEEARRICVFDHNIRLRTLGLPPQKGNLASIKASVRDVVAYLRSAEHGIDQPELFENVGVYTVDDAVPRELHIMLSQELDRLAAIEPKDFHPGSGSKVQDVIHPSLYPYAAEITPLPPSVAAPRTEDGEFTTTLNGTSPYGGDTHKLSSAFAWIPTIFTVSPDSQSVSIEGYINGLGSRRQYSLLYKLLEEAFSIVLPLLEKTFEHHYVVQDTPSYLRWRERWSETYNTIITREKWEAIRAKSIENKVAEHAEKVEKAAQRQKEKANERVRFVSTTPRHTASASIWAGRRLKVIVKAANYILSPGEEYTGSWHIEGMPHERIVASAIYYYDRDEGIEDDGLCLRRKRDGNEFPNHRHERHETFEVRLEEPRPEERTKPYDRRDYNFRDAPSDYGDGDVYMGALGGYVNLGIVPTTGPERQATGRIVAFPNWIQHRVMKVANGSKDKVATRKILCFFLVDDETNGGDTDEVRYHGFTYSGLAFVHVLSSVDVPSQARACNIPTLRFLLGVASRQRTSEGRTLPPEIVELIIDATLANGGLGITREEAETRRRALMKDRKVGSVDVNKVWEQEFSLCEH